MEKKTVNNKVQNQIVIIFKLNQLDNTFYIQIILFRSFLFNIYREI